MICYKGQRICQIAASEYEEAAELILSFVWLGSGEGENGGVSIKIASIKIKTVWKRVKA